jgi:predicted pyridoxine 5'-phosphate oxidase superfamily flavin-nucleotide-binding protein
MLSPNTVRLIREQRLGFVATVNGNGTPNLSPKGTFVVVDATTIAFAEIRSPATIENLAIRPGVEVNFVDAFTRRGCRVFGTADIVRRGDDRFDSLLSHFASYRGLMARARAVVLIMVSRSSSLTSPAYDDGATEADLRRLWTEHFRALQPGGRYTSEVDPTIAI